MAWGPDQKKLRDGNTMGMNRRWRLWSGEYVYWADCTDGWTSNEYTDYSDAEKQFGTHLGLQHGGR
jgi:hypothetical protein